MLARIETVVRDAAIGTGSGILGGLLFGDTAKHFGFLIGATYSLLQSTRNVNTFAEKIFRIGAGYIGLNLGASVGSFFYSEISRKVVIAGCATAISVAGFRKLPLELLY